LPAEEFIVAQPLQFDTGYRETMHLADGTAVRLRLLRPDDRQRLQQGFEHLSSASRHNRFMGAKSSISDAELSYFTELDQFDHFALGAVELSPAGDEGNGIGVARFIRLTSDPECAEVAITVIDPMQGNGIGRRLLERLVLAAVERGVRRFRFECLPSNREIQKLIHRVCDVLDTARDADGMVVEVGLPVEEPAVDGRPVDAFDPLFVLLRAFATNALKLQVGIGLRSVHRTLDAAFEQRDAWLGRRRDHPHR
jgi:GNAT superfamily N-acetyltransferase